MKGVVLAGGTGSRLWPITKATSKQLLPVYDKPMIYYPLSTLMLAGVRDILVITTPQDQEAFKAVLGDGSQFGINLSYGVQATPAGLAQALIIAQDFLIGESCLLILGDNIFHGVGLGGQLSKSLPTNGAHIFTYEVADPSQYGIVELDPYGMAISIEEKPSNAKSKLAVTGLYFFDDKASSIAKQVKPSARGELEITSVIGNYLTSNLLTVTQLSRGTVWLDTGNPNSMHDAATYIRVIEERTGLKISCLEEIAFNQGWITLQQLEESIRNLGSGSYAKYLETIAALARSAKI